MNKEKKTIAEKEIDSKNYDLYKKIIFYLLKNGIKNLSPTKINKLLFFLEYYGWLKKKKSLTKLKYITMPFGPVIDDYDLLFEAVGKEGMIKIDSSKKKRRFLKLKDKLSEDVLGELDEDLQKSLELITKRFKNWTAKEMSDFSHCFDLWNEKVYGYTILRKDFEKKDSFLQEIGYNGNFKEVVEDKEVVGDI